MKKRKGKRKLRGEEAEEAQRDAQRELLADELRMADANDRRQRLAWRQKMIAMNLPIVRNELEAAWRTFDRAIDDRDYSISVLLDELRISAEQKRRADIVHATEIDRLLELFKQHVDERRSRYEESIEQALDSVGQQVDQIEGEQEKQLQLRALVFSTKIKHQEHMENINTKHLSKLDGLKEENDNVLRMASAILKRRLRNHSAELAGVLRDHEENTKARRKDFEALREKDEKDRKVIADNTLRIEKLYETLHALKGKITEYRHYSDKELADCKFERDYFRSAWFAIQSRLLSEQMSDREHLKFLINEYHKTEEYLKKYIVTLKPILASVDLCKKYESYEDKILLYPLSTITDSICPHSSQSSIQSDTILQLFEKNHPLKKFSRIVSKVNRDAINLKISIKKLINESDHLKSSLKLYMNEVSKPSSKHNSNYYSNERCPSLVII
ncbi:uncharacterized protein LOC131672449 [Phymastichus coffea]|uniref:uncharacterized protein LOC131672449 n=1 Tax=Phymastichus coffea TaxID=108790 RepID=UPI00273BF4CE|nr:uncharacterized protein LOC131672449 [Phymastichus coffea]